MPWRCLLRHFRRSHRPLPRTGLNPAEHLEPRLFLSDTRLPASIAFAASTLHATYNDAIIFSVAVTADIPVTFGQAFLMEGNNILRTFILDTSGHASLSYSSLPTGVHTLAAQFAGDTTFLPRLSDPLTITIDRVPTSIALSTPPASIDFATTFQLTATVASAFGTPQGNVILKDGNATLTTLPLDNSGQARFTVAIPALGPQSLTVACDLLDPWLASSATTTPVAVNRAHAPLNLTDASTSSAYTLTARVPFAGSVPPTGNVTFKDGAAILATVPLSGGLAAYSLARVSSLAHTFSATYAGDADFFPAASTTLARSISLPVTLRLTSSAGYVKPGQAIALTAALATPVQSPFKTTGPITFREGSKTLAKVTPVNGKATFSIANLSPGWHTLTATFAADAHFRAAASAPLNEVVTSPYVVDLLVVYTPGAVADMGSNQALQATITNAVRDTDRAMLNSKIPVTIRLVHKEQVQYTETGSFDADLSNLSTAGDGQLDNVFALRNKYGADLVSLFVGSGDLAGLAYQMTDINSADNPNLGFSVILADEAAAPYYTLAHELGHNFGAAHDVAHDSGAIIAPDAHGYRFTAKGTLYHDIMAYDPGTTIPYYSNPAVDYLGVPTGKAGTADAARVITWTAPVVANYRKVVVSWKLPVLA
ncbi:MAG: Ig-like domain repeat protein [Tepidisphaerales bacterium]